MEADETGAPLTPTSDGHAKPFLGLLVTLMLAVPVAMQCLVSYSGRNGGWSRTIQQLAFAMATFASAERLVAALWLAALPLAAALDLILLVASSLRARRLDPRIRGVLLLHHVLRLVRCRCNATRRPRARRGRPWVAEISRHVTGLLYPKGTHTIGWGYHGDLAEGESPEDRSFRRKLELCPVAAGAG